MEGKTLLTFLLDHLYNDKFLSFYFTFTMVCLDVPMHLEGCPEMSVDQMRDQFQEMLVLCGIPPDGCKFLVNQGIVSANKFIKLPLDNGINDLKKMVAMVHVTPAGGFPPAVAANPNALAAPALPAQRNRGIDIPYMAWLNLCVLLVYTISLYQCGLALDYHLMEEDLLTKWCKYITQENDVDHQTPKDPPKLKNLEDWFDFKEALEAWALDMHGHSLTTPITYLLHNKTYVNAEMHVVDYDSITVMLIATTNHHGTHYQKDNALLYEVLKRCTTGGIGATQVSKYEKTRNGREAYEAIKEMAEGASGQALMRKRCYKLLEAVKYTNWNGQMSLVKTVNILEKTFVTLTKVGKTLSETHKVEYLHNSAAAKHLNTANAIIIGDDTKMNDFVKAKNFLLLHDGRSDAGRKCNRGISAAKQVNNKKHVNNKKPKSANKKKKVSLDNYDPAKDCIPNKEFWALSPNSWKKWNECRAVAHSVGAATTVPTLIDKAGAARFNLELYQLAKEHAHREIAKSCMRVLVLMKPAMMPRRSLLLKRRMLDGSLGTRDAKLRIDFSNLLTKVVLKLVMF
jgi:hypothetical protein